MRSTRNPATIAGTEKKIERVEEKSLTIRRTVRHTLLTMTNRTETNMGGLVTIPTAPTERLMLLAAVEGYATSETYKIRCTRAVWTRTVRALQRKGLLNANVEPTDLGLRVLLAMNRCQS